MGSEALEAWGKRGLHEVLLPSGTTVRIRIPEADQLIRKGLLTGELLEVASRFVTTGVELKDATSEELLRFDLMVRHMVANMIRGVQAEDGTWMDLPAGLQVELIDQLELPPDDIRALELIARRATTPAIITAASRASLAGLEAIDAAAPEIAAAAEREAAATVDGWAAFRREPEGAVDREDGSEVRPVPGDDVPRAA